jgi:plasmid stability protein
VAELKIRNVPQAQADALKARATENHRSVEAELRVILTAAVKARLREQATKE